MLKKWAFIISLIIVLEASTIHALESNNDLIVTKSENEGDELNEKIEEETSDDDSSSASESEAIQDAYSFIHSDKSMDVNKDNVRELIAELSQYSNSSAALEKEKIQIKQWIAILESKYKKLDDKEKGVKKEKDIKKAPKTPDATDSNTFDKMTNQQLMSAKSSITDEKELRKLQNVLRERQNKEKDVRERIKINREINDIDIKILTQRSDRIKENTRRKPSSSQNSNNANAESGAKTPSSDAEKSSSGSANNANSNSIPSSDPFFMKSDLKTILATDLTGLNLEQLNHLNNRLNREAYKNSPEVKKEIRLKIADVKTARDTKVDEMGNRGKAKHQTGGNSQGSSKPGESGAGSSGQSGGSDNGNTGSSGQSGGSDDGSAGSSGQSGGSDDGNADSTGQSGDSDNSGGQGDDVDKKPLKSEGQEIKKTAKTKVIQNRSMPANATKSNTSTSVYSIKDTVDRLRVIDLSRSSSALDE